MIRIETFVVVPYPPFAVPGQCDPISIPPHFFLDLSIRVTDHIHDTGQHHTTQQTITAAATKEKAEPHGTGKRNTQDSFQEDREEKHTCVCACRTVDPCPLRKHLSLLDFSLMFHGRVLFSFVVYLVSSRQSSLVFILSLMTVVSRRYSYIRKLF